MLDQAPSDLLCCVLGHKNHGVSQCLSFRGVACVCVCAEGSLVLANCKCNLTDKLFRVAHEVCVRLGGNNIVSCFFNRNGST